MLAACEIPVFPAKIPLFQCTKHLRTFLESPELSDFREHGHIALHTHIARSYRFALLDDDGDE